MAAKTTFGRLIRGVRRRDLALSESRPTGDIDDLAADDEEFSDFEHLLPRYDEARAAHLALLRGRRDELEAVQSVRSTVAPVVLSDEELSAFFTHGYLVVPQLSSPEELEVIRDIYDGLFAAKGLGGVRPDCAGAATYPKIHQIYRLAPELCATGLLTNARAMALQIWGDEVEFLGGHGFSKPARCVRDTPWHQDQAYHGPDLFFRNVNFWFAIQDSPLESGIMEFFPNSHLGAHVREHQRSAGDADMLELVDLSVEGDVVRCPLSAGGATLHHSYTLHYTAPNRSALLRRALTAVFGLQPQPRREPQHFAWQNAATIARPGAGPTRPSTSH